MMPISAVPSPRNRVSQPHQAGAALRGATNSQLRMMPYRPALIMAPESRAEMWLGAAGWASGSQTCMGAMPALAPKPSRDSTNRTEASGTTGPSLRARVAKAVSPAFCQSRPKKASSSTAPRWAATR